MQLKTLNGKEFKKMILVGADQLSQQVDLINSLNVFPVPDGDTGTNMNMTFQSGAERLKESQSNHVGELSQALAKGLLMGARGNSGVILSQIFRGFSQAIANEEELTNQTFVAAFLGAVESAYKAVMKPVEGTILTVARESALAGERKSKSTDNIIEIMEAIVEGARIALDKTPDLLPVLKQVGVVDSGGKGLLTIYEGFLSQLTGQELVSDEDLNTLGSDKHSHAIFSETNEHPLSMDEITYGYCTEIMVEIGKGPTTDLTFNYDEFRNTLNNMGDSLLVVADDEIIKVHVHTEDPGRVMQLGQQYGELIKIKVDNMREQVRELERADQSMQTPVSEQMPQELKTAVIAVATGSGIIETLQSIGVNYVLEGGQTMNPSTQDFVDAMNAVKAENYILMPNNKNIIMAAEQATLLADKPTVVIPTTAIPQSITAMLAYNPEGELEDNQAVMTEMVGAVKSGSITYAIRDTDIDGISIKKDDFMGLIDGNIKVAFADIKQTLQETLNLMIDENSEIVMVYIGEDGEEAVAEEVVASLEESHPGLEIEIVEGNQPVYNYLFSVE